MKTSLRRGFVRASLAAVAAAGMLLPFAGAAQADDTLDQTVPTGSVIPQSTSFFQNSGMAQTFTAGLTGQLDKVALYVGSGNTTRPSFRLEIWTVDTTRTVLTAVGTPASYQFQLPSTLRGWQSFNLSPTVSMQAGTKYAIVTTAVSFPLELRWYFMGGWDYSRGDLYCCAAGALMKDTTRDFAFQTYVAGASTPPPPPANTPPTLDPPVTAAVLAAEGSVPTNTGTYSDPDPDTVRITASSGTVTQTGTHSGTWSWTGTAADEDVPAQSVTISANDGHNPAVTRTFTLSFYAVKPSVTVSPAGTADPALASATKADEGSPLSFSGTVSSPAAADNSAGFTYAWSVTKDGAAYPASGAAQGFSFTPNDEGTYVVTLAATDDGGMTGQGSFTVSVADVVPTATITAVTPALTAPKIVLPNEIVTFSGTFTDPGTADPHSATWDFGDGTTAAGWTVSHYFTQAGTYSVTLTVSQGEDPGVGTVTTSVTVMTPSQALSVVAGYVNSLSGLNAGQKNSLVAKLDAASAAAARGDNTAATNQLNAFLNELMADLKTGKVSSTEAANLEDDIAAIKAALGNYNRLLDFWPVAA